MMILLSIKQVYCDLILKGTKRFEFRKKLPNGLKKGDEVAIYCTRPVSKVIAYFRVSDVIQTTRQSLWRQTRLAARARQISILWHKMLLLKHQSMRNQEFSQSLNLLFLYNILLRTGMTFG